MACSTPTAQAVAENFGVDVSVEASDDLDLRGTLSVDEEAPVGFEDIASTYPSTASWRKRPKRLSRR